jgi:hypothetical protein
MCSASSQGVYIKIMCILHKQKKYGTILLKQKDKQNSSSIINFACVLSRLLPFNEKVITESLNELIEEEVLFIKDDYLCQKRMVKDGAISDARSMAGKKGGGNPNLLKQTPKQTDKQIPENENENEDNIEDKNSIFISLENLPIELSGEMFLSDASIFSGMAIDKAKKLIPEFILKIKHDAKTNYRPLGEHKSHFQNWLKSKVVPGDKINKVGTVFEDKWT